MCHIILLLPIISLVLFWILPLAYALPLYLVVLVASILVYFAMMKAMKRPVTTGKEGLIGEIAEVKGYEWSKRTCKGPWRNLGGVFG